MAARSVPVQPSFVTASEQQVWQKVTRSLEPGCVVLANLRVSDQHKDHEADLVCLMPGSGIVVVEVKGGHVWTGPDGKWLIERYGQPQQIRPVDQARDAMYALRHYVERDARWQSSRTRVRWSHHVVLAGTRLDPDFATPDLPRWQVTGSDELGEVGVRIWDTTSLHKTGARPPDAEDVALIEEILTGRYLPARDVVALARDRQEWADRLTREQSDLLGVTRLLNRVEIRGGAGSGKTVLAIRQAAELARGKLTGVPQRVAVVCYSNGLALHLQRELLQGPRGRRPAFVGTFEQLGSLWGAPSGSRDDPDFWEQRLPALMADLALALTDGRRFDAIIVDEAQDFADGWWTCLLRALRDEETGGLFAYSDERQRVFPRFGRPPIALVPLVLDHNLRNTRQIAESFLPLAPTGMDLRGGEGPEVTFVVCATQDALQVADDQVEALFDEGWRTQDIALLTLGKRHPVQAERQEALGQQGYWEQYWESDDIFYGHVLGFKGLERPAIVLCVNEDGTRDRSAERLYVGMSRATDRLIVVGDPQVVRRIGGPDVAARLGMPG